MVTKTSCETKAYSTFLNAIDLGVFGDKDAYVVFTDSDGTRHFMNRMRTQLADGSIKWLWTEGKEVTTQTKAQAKAVVPAVA